MWKVIRLFGWKKKIKKKSLMLFDGSKYVTDEGEVSKKLKGSKKF